MNRAARAGLRQSALDVASTSAWTAAMTRRSGSMRFASSEHVKSSGTWSDLRKRIRVSLASPWGWHPGLHLQAKAPPAHAQPPTRRHARARARWEPRQTTTKQQSSETTKIHRSYRAALDVFRLHEGQEGVEESARITGTHGSTDLSSSNTVFNRSVTAADGWSRPASRSTHLCRSSWANGLSTKWYT